MGNTTIWIFESKGENFYTPQHCVGKIHVPGTCKEVLLRLNGILDTDQASVLLRKGKGLVSSKPTTGCVDVSRVPNGKGEELLEIVRAALAS